MKIYRLNSITTTLFICLIIGLVVILPIVFIETLWNSTVGKTYVDIAIDFWQALILWLIALVLLSILGLFKFEFAIETKEGFDKELLNQKLQSLQNKTDKQTETTAEVKDSEGKNS